MLRSRPSRGMNHVMLGRFFRKIVQIVLPTMLLFGCTDAGTRSEGVAGTRWEACQTAVGPKETSLTPSRVAWLDAGNLPIISGGRSLEVRLHDPGRVAADLEASTFQACIANGNVVYPAAGVDLDPNRTNSGVATLGVWMPQNLGAITHLWGSADVIIRDPARGTSVCPVPAHLGNPAIAALAALALMALSVWLIAIVSTRLGT